MSGRASTRPAAAWIGGALLATLLGITGAARAQSQTPPPPQSPPEPSFPSQTVNVKDQGAKGDGSTNDTSAINKAISAVSSAGGGTVTFPSGTYMAASIHLKSNVRLQLQSGATIKAKSSGYDAPESNSFDKFQDFGHSHFHNALMWGDGISNVAVVGPGHIDGDGLSTGDPSSGGGDKQIACKSCDRLLFDGLTQTKGGHFFYLLTDCTNVTLHNLTISDGRDGIDLVGCKNCEASGVKVTGVSDDALPLKNDFSTGQRLLTESVYIHDTTLGTACNAIQFGSETAGDFRDIWFKNITVVQAGKAGIGIQTNDGGLVENVYIDNVTMSKAANPIFINSSPRLRTPEHVGIGHVHNIHISNVTATNVVKTNSKEPANAATISGRPGIMHEDITLTNIKITYKGGGSFADGNISPPYSPSSNYNPRSIGTRPAYGFFVRHVHNLEFHNVSVDFESSDLRPAWNVFDVNGLELDDIGVERAASGAQPSLKLSKVEDFNLHNSSQFADVSLATIDTASFSPGQPPPPPPPMAVRVFKEAEAGTISAPMQTASDALASGGAYITVAAGNDSKDAAPATGHSAIAFDVPASGTYRVWGRVIAGSKEDDSFWVRVDGGPWVKWNDVAVGTSWHWVVVEDDATAAVATFELAAGSHTLTVAYREDGARLDKLLITNDASFTPSGMGQ
jgi:hypothetical protein